MTNRKTLIVMFCIAGLLPLATAQSATPPRITSAEVKNHPGETVIVCGKVVDSKIFRYGTRRPRQAGNLLSRRA